MEAETKVKVVAILEILGGVFALFTVILLILFMSKVLGSGVFENIQNTSDSINVMYAVFSIFAILVFVSGVGLLRRRKWGRMMTIFFSFAILALFPGAAYIGEIDGGLGIFILLFGLSFFPFGLLGAILALVFLFRQDVRAVFENNVS